MASKFRKSPPVCLFISLSMIITGKLRILKRYKSYTVKTEEDQEFTIFRHITRYPPGFQDEAVTFIVRFKFAHLTHAANKLASIIPMLLITGFPGFQTKMYAVNKKNGFWQGMYQWKTQEHLEDYLQSFVYKMMNNRAINETNRFKEYHNQLLINLTEQLNGKARKK